MSRCKNIVVTGANRGLGLALVKHLNSKLKPDNIFATYRDAASAQELLELAKTHTNIHPVVLEVRATEKYDELVKVVEAKTKGAGLNLLINNSGYGNKENNTSLTQLEKDDLINHFEINTIAPIMLTKAFLPLLEKASKEGEGPLGIGRAVVVNISTRLAYIEENLIGTFFCGGAYGYRISKTALNMACRNMSIELIQKGIIVIPLHPGWVKTDMGGQNAMLEIDESVGGMVSVIEKLDESSNGRFWFYDGSEGRW